jgi:dTMP kinase
MEKGKLIAIDGIDSSFKETQVGLAKNRLFSEGFLCETMDFPRYKQQPTGRIIGQCYLGKDPQFYGWKGDSGWFPEGAENVDPLIASPYYAGDRYREQPTLKKWLSEGKIVLLDRYDSANKIHQGGKIKSYEERIKFWKKLDLLEFEYYGNLRSDLTILLYNPIEIAIKIEKTGNEKKDGHENSFTHLKEAEESALQAAQYYNWKVVKCANGKTTNTLRNREEIHEEVYKHIKEIL